MPANTKSYFDSSLTQNTTYYYRILAENADGVSPSFSVSAKTLINLPQVTLPGRIEAENYNHGGQNTGYYDATTGNTGGRYRNDDVDIQTTEDSIGTYHIGFIEDNEWLNYTLNSAPGWFF